MIKRSIAVFALLLMFIFMLYLTVVEVESSFALSVGTAANSNLDIALNRALNEKNTISKTYQINKEISVYSLYLPFLSYLESHNPYFKKCGVVTRPRVLNDFMSSGAGINTRYGINTYAVDLMQKKAVFGMKNKMISQKKVKRYMLCVAGYGLVLSQAFKDFNNSLHNGAGSVMANNVYGVPNDAFYNLVGESLYNAIVSQSERIKKNV